MKSTKSFIVVILLGSVASLTFIVGCNKTSEPTESTPPNSLTTPTASPTSNSTINPNAESDSDQEHGHIPGAHGGIMVSLGRDSYHIEAVVDATGAIRLYTLGKDESRVIDIEQQSLIGFVKSEGATESVSITFEAAPQDGDAEGRTSLFIGHLPSDSIGKALDVTIPNIRIDGERFRLGFQTAQTSHDNSADMPAKLADKAENDLYLTPAGRYTAADVAANGNTTASKKFKGLRAAHDMKPAIGDKLCPISGTKANPKFTWIVDGKPYQFCCPPCVDEFVQMAKESSEPLPDPDTFIKK